MPIIERLRAVSGILNGGTILPAITFMVQELRDYPAPRSGSHPYWKRRGKAPPTHIQRVMRGLEPGITSPGKRRPRREFYPTEEKGMSSEGIDGNTLALAVVIKNLQEGI